MESDFKGTFVPTGKPCWGCKNLSTEQIPMVGEDFYCTGDNKRILLGRIRRIMEGIIVPRELNKGCYTKRD